jgi:transcriptional regulator with XRE-family HTH domain
MKNLKKIRKLLDYKQEDIAKLLNVSFHTYSRYELGKVKISIDKLIILANLFDCTTDYLLDRTNQADSIKDFEYASSRMSELTKDSYDEQINRYFGDHLRDDEVRKVRILLEKIEKNEI